MINKALTIIFILLFTSTTTYASDYRYIEIFCIDKEEVVKTVQSNSQIQKLIENYMKNIEGIYCKFDPVPKSGYAVKIPLDPSVKLQTKISDSQVDFVVIMFPKEDSPFLMCFEKGTNLVCYTFKGDTDKLLKAIDYTIDN